MTLRKLLKIILGLLIVITVTAGLTSIDHPIILKWFLGTARVIGKPIKATVYTNGQINYDIKIFHVQKYHEGTDANYYIVYTPYTSDSTGLKVFIINKKGYSYVGRPSGTSIRDYDFIAGVLFQSDVGELFTTFQNDMKGYDFDPKLTINNRQIKLDVSPIAEELKCDSIRIEL
jgi:hypothetical protein